MPADNATNSGRVTDTTRCDGDVILDLIISKNVGYHIDKTGEPCLLLPGDSLERAYPIQSRRVRAYIAALAWTSLQMLPSTAELDRVLRVLEGLAWEAVPRDATQEQLWHSLQETPVLHVVIEFMQEREKHEAQMQSLLTDLEAVAQRHRFDLFTKRWPKTAAHLSALLRKEQNRGILKQFGIVIDITRDRNGANVVLSRVTPSIPGDAEYEVASPTASHDKLQLECNLEVLSV